MNAKPTPEEIVVADIAVKQISRLETHRAIELLLRAFRDDPTCNFLFQSGSPKYVERMRAFFEAGSCDHFSAGQPVLGLFSAGNLIGAAYLRNPKSELTSWTVLRWLGMTRELGCACRLLRYVIDAKRTAPKGDHYTVVLLGIDPAQQGLGYGSALMRSVHEFCYHRSEGVGLLLDTGNPRNIPFYERLGYREVGSFRLGNVNQRVMYKQQQAANAGLPTGKIAAGQEKPRCSSGSPTSTLTFEVSAEMPLDFIPLVEAVHWGTQGALYRVKDYRATLEALPSRLHMLLRKSGELVAARVAIEKSFSEANGPINAFYHSLFSVVPSEQGKGYGKFLARCTLNHLEKLLHRTGFIYAYIEEGNARSAAIAASLGYRRFGHFYAHPISRFFPKSSPLVHRADEREQDVLRRLLEERYRGHALTDFSLSFNASDYWILNERGNPIAGVQVSPQLWQIERLPGLSGTVALKVVPQVPFLRGLFDPRAWRFLKIGNIYFQPGRPEAFFELLDDLLHRYHMKTAALYIDHRSPVYEELRASQHFGILDPLMQTKVNVWGFLEYLSPERVSELYSRPLAISAVDV